MRKVNDGSELVNRSGETLGEIVASIKTVSGLVAEIAAASRDRPRGIVQINQAVLQMDQFTQTNGNLVAQAATASQTMAQRAGELNGVMERYQLDEAHQPPDAPAPVMHAPQAPEPAPQVQPAPARAVERRSAARPWVANGSAKSAKSKAAPLPPKFNKVADDDSDWKEF